MTRISLADTEGQSAHLRAVSGDAPRDSLIEVRVALPNGGMAAEFHRVERMDRVLEVINRRARTTDVFVGCAPRCRPAGSKDAIDQVWTLWAECDSVEASAAACAHMPRPALVVASGTPGNVHAYWPLRQPVSAPDAERANLRLAVALGADRNCFDATRILRPPGTWNHKHHPPRPVDVIDHRLAVRFQLDEVVGGLAHVDVGKLERRWAKVAPRRAHNDPLLRIPPHIYVGELVGVRALAGGKVRCPFHADTRPSLHVYKTADRGWHCFSCRRGGSIYDLAAELWAVGTRGREFIELRQALNEMFPIEHERQLPGR